MDMSMMQKKLDAGEYPNTTKFFGDFKLMIRNCFVFNPLGMPVNQAGINLQRLFDEKWRHLPPLWDASNDEDKESEEERNCTCTSHIQYDHPLMYWMHTGRIATMEAQLESMRSNLMALKNKPAKEKKKMEKKEKARVASSSKGAASRAPKGAPATNGNKRKTTKKPVAEDDVLSFEQKKDLSRVCSPMTLFPPQWVPMALCTPVSRSLMIPYKNGSTSLQPAYLVTSRLTAFVVGVHSTGSCLLLWASGGHLLKFVGGVDGLKASMYVFQSLSADIVFEFFCSHCIQRDTLVRYLLDELHAYETDYSDALAPISRGADASLASEHALASPTSTEELRSVAADVNGLRSDIGSVNDTLRSLTSVVVQAACTAAMALQHLDSSQHFAAISDSEPCASRTLTLHCTIQSDRMPQIHVLLHLEARTVPSHHDIAIRRPSVPLQWPHKQLLIQTVQTSPKNRSWKDIVEHRLVGDPDRGLNFWVYTSSAQVTTRTE
jgi:hypothetical protein